MQLVLQRHPIAVCVALGCLAFVAIVALRASGKLQAVELLAYDQHLRWRVQGAAPDQRIVLVGVTEQDIHDFGWPLPDGILAELLDRLAALGPRAIGLDLYRDIAVPPGQERLKTTLSQHENVIGIMKFGAPDAGRIQAPAVLQGTERIGFSDVIVDPDGTVRRGLLFLDEAGHTYYSLGLRLALRYLEQANIAPQPGVPDPAHMRLGETTLRPFESDDGGYKGADAAGYQFLLDFRGGEFPHYSVRDVLSGVAKSEAIHDKVILIGVTADSVKDYFHTPVGTQAHPNAPVFGITLHAHSTSQLLRAALGAEAPTVSPREWQKSLWTWVWTLLGALVGYRVRAVTYFALVTFSGLVLLLLAAQGAFNLGWWIPLVPPALGWVIAAMAATSYMSYQEKEQRRLLMHLFSRHVSPSVAELVWQQREQLLTGGRLRPQKLLATVLFSDLQGFTTISEKLDPQALMNWLNVYMESMASLVSKHGGIVDKFIGDAVMAVFGVPLPRTSSHEIQRDACNAVRCALAMGLELQRLNALWQADGLPPAVIRIGIFTGELVAGSLGSIDRMEYTVLGDTVNTASRLESYDKSVGAPGPGSACRILVGSSTFEYLAGQFDAVPVGRIKLKGKEEEVLVYQVKGESMPIPVQLAEEGAR